MWVLSAFSGLILWLAPDVCQAGRQPLLLGITKQDWGEIHFWICVAVVVVTIVYIIIDWKALRGVIRYLTSVHRATMDCTPMIGQKGLGEVGGVGH